MEKNINVPIKPIAVCTEVEVCNRCDKILSRQLYASKLFCVVVVLKGVIRIKKIKKNYRAY